MKIFIKNSESFEEKIELEIEELELISNIRESISKKSVKFVSNFSLIYEDIIMHNDEKCIEYYKISSNDEIWYGKLEDYLERGHVIIELFVKQFYSEIIFLIINKSNSILQLKSKILKIIPNILNVWNTKGVDMANDQIIGEIDVVNGYYRLIINCTQIGKQAFYECCQSYNEYFIRNYISQYEWLNMLYQDISDFEYIFLVLIHQAKLFISSNDTMESVLDKRINTSFMSSQFLFCVEISKRIFDYFWQKSGNLFLNGYSHGDFRYFLTTASHIKISEFINSQLNQSNEYEKSMRDILYDSLDCLENFLNESNNNWQDFVKKFLTNFLYPSDSEINEMFDEGCKTNSYISVKAHQRETGYFISKHTKTIFDAKKSISIQTGIPMEYLYCLKYSNEIKPKDDDLYEFVDDYIIEIALSREKIGKGKYLGSGAYGQVMLHENKNKEYFALKTPVGEKGDLYRDINSQSRISFLHITNYTGLFHDGKNFCMAMKYFQGKSVRKYLENESLSENDIAKICYDVLLQINSLHENQLIHRDIKSDNILIDDNKNAELIDFGLSKWTERSTSEEMMKKLADYKRGTVFYMAPEIIKSKLYTNKIDIWSFGVTVIEMATGKIPCGDFSKTRFLIELSRTGKLKYKLEKSSKELSNFIEFCMIPDSEDRYSAKQLLQTEFIIRFLEMNKD